MFPESFEPTVQKLSEKAHDVVWTPVRLRDSMPSVEWGSPDATLPSQVLRLAEEAMLEGIESPDVATSLERRGFDVEGYDPITRQIGHRESVDRELRLRIRRATEARRRRPDP